MTKTSTPNPTDADLRAHFGLSALPFTREIAVRDRWSAALFDEPLEELRTVVENRMSAALLAPAGTGKTVLLRALVARLPEARYRVHYIKVTNLSRRDFCREIAVAVGAEPAGSYPMLVRRLQERFQMSLGEDGRRPVLLIDEAHDLRPDVLAILRILTNFEMDSRLVLSLLLAGQPRLRALLDRQEVEAVTQRLALVLTLRLLSRTELRSYIEHRLRTAGCKKPPFDEPALDALYEVSRGNLRAADQVALGALSLAARRSIAVVDAALIAEARQRLVP
jgi:type II secretory pathway predicted ATPase ExeA